MKRVLLLIAALLAIACGGQPSGPAVSKEPVSVRGWIVDVEGGPSAPFRTVETEAARKVHLFQQTYVDVANAPYVTGGVSENGSFILLDVPPGNVVITFSAPGAPAARLEMNNVPGNADVFIPALLLRKDSVALTDPAAVQVRLAAHIDRPRPTKLSAVIAGVRVPVIEAPFAQMMGRHDYPTPPTQLAPIAKVK